MNDTLEKLGTPKEYHRMRNLIKWIIVMWLIIICIIWAINSLCSMALYDDSKVYLIIFIADYPFYINILVDIMIMLSLRFVYV